MPELDEGGTRVPSKPPAPRPTDGLSYTERYRGTEYDSSGLPVKEESADPLAGIASAVRSLFGGRGQQAPTEPVAATGEPDAADPDAGLIDAPGRPPIAPASPARAARPRFGAPADLLTAPPAPERISYVEYEEDDWDEDRPLAAAQPMVAPEAPPQMAPAPMDQSPLPPPDRAQPSTAQTPLPPPERAQAAPTSQVPLPLPDWAQRRRPAPQAAGQVPAQPARPPAAARPAPKAVPATQAPAQAAQPVARAAAAAASVQPARPVARAAAVPARPAQASAAQPAPAPVAASAAPHQPARKPPRGSVISRQPAAPLPARPSQVARQSAASARAAEQFRAAEAARVPMRDEDAAPLLLDDDAAPLLLDDDDIPYSERYRGTEWDSNAKPAGRGLALAGLTRRALPVAIVVVLVAAGIGAVAMFGRGILDGLTGSGNPAPGGSKVIAQFRELAETPDLPFHVAMSTTITGGNEPIELDAEMDMVDGDSAGTVIFTEAGARIALEMIVKGGATYARVPGAPWQLVPLKQQGILSPLTELGALTGYEDLGLEERGGVSLRHLRTTEARRADLDAVIELFGDVATIRSSVIDLYLTEDGVPVEMTGTATMSLNQSGKSKQATLAFSYRFSQVGQALTIDAPV